MNAYFCVHIKHVGLVLLSVLCLGQSVILWNTIALTFTVLADTCNHLLHFLYTVLCPRTCGDRVTFCHSHLKTSEHSYYQLLKWVISSLGFYQERLYLLMASVYVLSNQQWLWFFYFFLIFFLLCFWTAAPPPHPPPPPFPPLSLLPPLFCVKTRPKTSYSVHLYIFSCIKLYSFSCFVHLEGLS